LRLATFLTKHLPRGKGWSSRLIGRRFGRGMKTTIRLPDGALLAVDPSNLEIYTALAVKGGSYDPHVLEACAAVMKPGDIFFDIGANAGVVSIGAASRFKDEVSVFAFEPQPSLARSIAVSAAMNGFRRVQVMRIMLGRENDEAELFLTSHAVHASAIPREAHATRLPCQVRTVDSLVQGGILPPPQVIKIDVEGGELDAFRGAEQTLRRHTPWLMFEADENMERFGYDRRVLMDYLKDVGGYSFVSVGPRGFLSPVQPVQSGGYNDILAIPPGKSVPDTIW
jgi:FkbM family methyltransferase